MLNPYGYYTSEPWHLARFIKDGKKYLCGWDLEHNSPIMKHDVSVIKMAEEKNYNLPMPADMSAEWRQPVV